MKLSKILSLSLLIWLLYSCNGDTVRKKDFAIQGIDVSHYQKVVDWSKVADQGFQFTFMKASEGLDFKDSMFVRNWSGSKEAGMIRGAYHFFRPSLDVQEQFENFSAQVKLFPGDLAPVLDVEVEDGVPLDSLTARVNRWLLLAENHYGIRPIVYTYQNFYNKKLQGAIKGYPLWIARYNRFFEPNLTDCQWDFWQYGHRGLIEGVEGYVDLNVFVGDKGDFDKFIYEPVYNGPSDEIVAP